MQAEVKWSANAFEAFQHTIKYWNERNKSTAYSQKVETATRKLIFDISQNPFFLAKYYHQKKLYRRIFFKGKFSLYYKVSNNLIYIVYFRSNRQKPVL